MHSSHALDAVAILLPQVFAFWHTIPIGRQSGPPELLRSPQMITFHPAARKTSAGFVPMVTLRKDKGRMVGSKLSQGCNVFESAQEALAHAVMAASRVVAQYPDTMRLAA